MPFVANTPESLLRRSDSKDPGQTCGGITSGGRPCRRPIARPVEAFRRPLGHQVAGDDSLYCWQHKEQARHSTPSSPAPQTKPRPILEDRCSLETLADRLGLVDLQDGRGEKPRSGARLTEAVRPATQRPPKSSRPKAKKQLYCCLCFSIPIEPTHDSRRPRPRPLQQGPVSAPMPGTVPVPAASGKSPKRQRVRDSDASQMAHVKDLIPDTLDPATASALLAELSRPYADAEEAGYIYMFWLTPASRQSAPPVDAARSLLASPKSSPARAGGRTRRPSDVVSQFAAPSGGGGSARMLLKIGRAANVQRRMNQWQRQCGYDIEMLRYYPYLPGASDVSPSARSQLPRTTPHCRRVERLIHLELAGMGHRANLGTCDTCARDHREWFEVETTREGIRKIDKVIRRWVEWDEASS
ncbi:hypothetical protein RJ55_04632 [Drechmeria coniospora]|nr:hypothetical protein RJ55_04632 [Drechmeria coniospora]